MREGAQKMGFVVKRGRDLQPGDRAATFLRNRLEYVTVVERFEGGHKVHGRGHSQSGVLLRTEPNLAGKWDRTNPYANGLVDSDWFMGVPTTLSAASQ